MLLMVMTGYRLDDESSLQNQPVLPSPLFAELNAKKCVFKTVYSADFIPIVLSKLQKYTVQWESEHLNIGNTVLHKQFK